MLGRHYTTLHCTRKIKRSDVIFFKYGRAIGSEGNVRVHRLPICPTTGKVCLRSNGTFEIGIMHKGGKIEILDLQASVILYLLFSKIEGGVCGSVAGSAGFCIE